MAFQVDVCKAVVLTLKHLKLLKLPFSAIIQSGTSADQKKRITLNSMLCFIFLRRAEPCESVFLQKQPNLSYKLRSNEHLPADASLFFRQKLLLDVLSKTNRDTNVLLNFKYM